MVLHMVLKRKAECLNLLQCSRLDIQISISVRMAVGNKWNNYACEGLSCYGGFCRVILRWCVLRVYANNSQGYFLLLVRPYPIFLVNVCGVVMFSEMWGFFMNNVTKCVCMLMIDICINCSGGHTAGSIGRIVCTSDYGCVFVCIVVWDCIHNRVTRGGLSRWCVFWYGNVQVIFDDPFICVRTNKIDYYGKPQVVCDHMNVHVHKNKR